MEFEEPLREVGLALARFAAFAAHGLLCGTVAVLLLVFRPAYAALPGGGWRQGRKRLAERLEGFVQAALVTAATATVLSLLLQATVVQICDARTSVWIPSRACSIPRSVAGTR